MSQCCSRGSGGTDTAEGAVMKGCTRMLCVSVLNEQHTNHSKSLFTPIRGDLIKSQQITFTFACNGFVKQQKTVLFTAEYEICFIYICIARLLRISTVQLTSSPSLPFFSDWFKTGRKRIFQRQGLIPVCLSGITLKCAPYKPLKLPPGAQTAARVTAFTSAPFSFLWIGIALLRRSKWDAGKVVGFFKGRSWWDLDVLFSAAALNSLLISVKLDSVLF